MFLPLRQLNLTLLGSACASILDTAVFQEHTPLVGIFYVLTGREEKGTGHPLSAPLPP